MEKVHRTNLKDLIRSSGGRFFTVVFLKRDGQVRAMNARLGVRKDLKGGENKVVTKARPYMTVYDVKKRGYRTVNLATVTEVRLGGTGYLVEG